MAGVAGAHTHASGVVGATSCNGASGPGVGIGRGFTASGGNVDTDPGTFNGRPDPEDKPWHESSSKLDRRQPMPR